MPTARAARSDGATPLTEDIEMTDNKAKPPGQGEPSMEEILASIRRIISEDGDPAKPAAAAAPAVAPAPVPQAPQEPESAPSDILVLTEVAEEEPASTPAPPPQPTPLAVPAPDPEPQRSPMPTDAGEILSATVAAAASGALSSLVSAKRQTERPMSDNPMPLGNPGATLESIVRDEIRPLLKAWLDANLPGMVERIVQREIQRISRNLE